MKKFFLISILLCLYNLCQAQLTKRSIYDALSQLNTKAIPKEYDSNGYYFGSVSSCGLNWGDVHNQGAAYNNGYYYVTRNIVSSCNYGQLVIIKDYKIVGVKTLNYTRQHPGGIQICDNLLVVPYNTGNIEIYSLTDPLNPQLVKTIYNDYSNQCAGIIKIGNQYLISSYFKRSGGICFYLLDNTLEVIKSQIWDIANQSTNDWFPWTYWNDTNINYENMNLLSVNDNNNTKCYALMFRNGEEEIDVFEINDYLINDPIKLTMTCKLPVEYSETGFRFGGGSKINEYGELCFYSIDQRINESDNANNINEYNISGGYNQIKLPYLYDRATENISITMDNAGNCLMIQRGAEISYNPKTGPVFDDNIYYRYGKINKYSHRINWTASIKTPFLASEVDIDLNNNGWCVMAHKSSSGSNLYYNVGKINHLTQTIDWGNPVKWDTGGSVSMSIDDNLNIVEVHRGDVNGAHRNNHYYNVGKVNTDTKTISWKNSGGTKYDTGSFVSVSMNNNGQCVESHSGSSTSLTYDNKYYKFGTINFATGEINWTGSTKYDTGGKGEIEINNAGHCIEVHRGFANNSKVYCKFGMTDFVNKSIQWLHESSVDQGFYLSASIDNNNYVTFLYPNDNKYLTNRSFIYEPSQTMIYKSKAQNTNNSIISKNYTTQIENEDIQIRAYRKENNIFITGGAHKESEYIVTIYNSMGKLLYKNKMILNNTLEHKINIATKELMLIVKIYDGDFKPIQTCKILNQ